MPDTYVLVCRTAHRYLPISVHVTALSCTQDEHVMCSIDQGGRANCNPSRQYDRNANDVKACIHRVPSALRPPTQIPQLRTRLHAHAHARTSTPVPARLDQDPYPPRNMQTIVMVVHPSLTPLFLPFTHQTPSHYRSSCRARGPAARCPRRASPGRRPSC